MKRLLIFTGLLVAAIITLQAKDFSFKVEVTGKGKPMLLIPGLSSSGDVWDETVARLKDQYECHVVTLPGFADQPAIETDQFLETVGDELISYIKRNKLKNPVVMGHSLGGFLTVYIGIREPDLASKLIVVDGLPYMGAAQNPVATPAAMKATAEMMRNNILSQTTEQFEQMQPVILKSMITSPEKVTVAMDWSRSSDTKTVAQAMFELYQIDLRDQLDQVNAPMLVLASWYGYKDYGVTKQMIEASFSGQFGKAKDVRISVSDEGRHFIMWDDPEFFFSEIGDFLNEKG